MDVEGFPVIERLQAGIFIGGQHDNALPSVRRHRDGPALREVFVTPEVAGNFGGRCCRGKLEGGFVFHERIVHQLRNLRKLRSVSFDAGYTFRMRHADPGRDLPLPACPDARRELAFAAAGDDRGRGQHGQCHYYKMRGA